MSYPQYPPQGGPQYPPQNPQYGQRPPGPYPPQRKSTPAWAWALVAVGVVLVLAVVGGAIGGSGEEESAAAASTSSGAAPAGVTSVSTAPAVAEPTTRAAPAVESPLPAAPPPVAPVAPPVTTETPAPAPAAIMPAVVCMNLQDAQDLIQAAGVFFSRSSDATGQGRRQVLDRNWVVVGQQPAPGETIGEFEAVLSVVKIGETSQCG
ncbi:hypothetical protein [Nocardia higoensis]|uniref:hypothetical protein n=1 Tax=Nocardia higoensis TaxID=228599 RepID=UPI0002F46823|nr:hypothetical protein [Nocardia higoensis]